MKNGTDKKILNIFHAEITLEGCNAALLDNQKWIEDLLKRAATTAQMKIINTTTKSHKFHPQGITAYVLLAESHISIHTWPEYGKAIVDILTCNSKHVENAIQLFTKELCPNNFKISRIDHSNDE